MMRMADGAIHVHACRCLSRSLPVRVRACGCARGTGLLVCREAEVGEDPQLRTCSVPVFGSTQFTEVRSTGRLALASQLRATPITPKSKLSSPRHPPLAEI